MAWTLCYPWRIPEPVISPSSSVCPSKRVGPDQIAPPSFLPDSVWIFVYSPGYRIAILLVLMLISVRVALYVVVVLMCLWGKMSPVSSYSSILIFPKLFLRCIRVVADRYNSSILTSLHVYLSIFMQRMLFLLLLKFWNIVINIFVNWGTYTRVSSRSIPRSRIVNSFLPIFSLGVTGTMALRLLRWY